MNPMCQALFEGPVDVVGDVHGEFEALDQLLDVLGYHAENGWKHPEGRRLVFVGDLVDRGPNSPSLWCAMICGSSTPRGTMPPCANLRPHPRLSNGINRRRRS